MNAILTLQLRRWNENGVDLNRNYLTAEEFAKATSRDPNRHGYVDFFDLINPGTLLDWKDNFFLRAGYYILRYGFDAMKQTVVTGNYHFPGTLFYGGQSLQPSHKLLQDFLQISLEFQRNKP